MVFSSRGLWVCPTPLPSPLPRHALIGRQRSVHRFKASEVFLQTTDTGLNFTFSLRFYFLRVVIVSSLNFMWWESCAQALGGSRHKKQLVRVRKRSCRHRYKLKLKWNMFRILTAHFSVCEDVTVVSGSTAEDAKVEILIELLKSGISKKVQALKCTQSIGVNSVPLEDSWLEPETRLVASLYVVSSRYICRAWCAAMPVMLGRQHAVTQI